jgi:hypothetical protein
MQSRDFSANRGPDLGETRRRFLFAREHLAAHAPRARHQPVLRAGVRGERRDHGSAGRPSSTRAA